VLISSTTINLAPKLTKKEFLLKKQAKKHKIQKVFGVLAIPGLLQ
jgi:hypothetical protein